MLKALLNRAFRIATLLKSASNTVFLLNLRKTPILKKFCERVLLELVQISPELPHFDNLHFRLKLVPVLLYLYCNLQFRLPILHLILLILL